MMRGLNRFLRAKKGAALVEFSLLAPVLVMLMCGMCEFSNAMRQYHIMEKGVRDAGRYLARVPMTGCTVNGGAITAARNVALTGQTSGGTNLLRTWSDPNTITITVAQCFNNSSGTYRGHAQMPVIQVEARAPYADLGMLSVLGFSAFTLDVTHQQLWIGG